MLRILFAMIFVLIVGCAKQTPEFVPVSINWFQTEGEAIDEPQEERCQIALTRSLMEDETVRDSTNSGRDFDVQYFGERKGDDFFVEFRGKCRNPQERTDFEKEPLTPSDVKNCNFTARCDAKGKVRNLKIF